METVETNDTKGWVIGAVVLVVVVVGGWWMIKHSKPSSSVIGNNASSTEATAGDNLVDVNAADTSATAPKEPTAASEAAAKSTVTTPAGGETVSIKDQAAGTSIAIDSMKLSAASWVAIVDNGHVLGAAWYPSYATTGSVSLLRSTAAGKTYQAVIYVDDGDKKFDMHKDALVSGVSASFSAK